LAGHNQHIFGTLSQKRFELQKESIETFLIKLIPAANAKEMYISRLVTSTKTPAGHASPKPI